MSQSYFQRTYDPARYFQPDAETERGLSIDPATGLPSFRPTAFPNASSSPSVAFPDHPEIAPLLAGDLSSTSPTSTPSGATSTPHVPPEVVTVRLPNGEPVPDPTSPTGQLQSPVDDLSPVAAAGRKLGATYKELLSSAYPAEVPVAYLAGALYGHLGHGGTFDYQRRGNQLLGELTRGSSFTQLPAFRNVSNFNVGLLCQQAGLSLEDALTFAGGYALLKSRNSDSSQPYGLDPDTRRFIERGFKAGQSGIYGKPTD